MNQNAKNNQRGIDEKDPSRRRRAKNIADTSAYYEIFTSSARMAQISQLGTFNPATFYNVYGHGDYQLGQSAFQIEQFKVDLYDNDLEDDDIDLYDRLSIREQMLVMRIRQGIQTALLNK